LAEERGVDRYRNNRRGKERNPAPRRNNQNEKKTFKLRISVKGQASRTEMSKEVSKKRSNYDGSRGEGR